ncbi:MAG: AraC family transcriptional regulator [Epulopiscium sp.]|nr:AraC family transcriptional regulator [Candidatus Epulonipiscium sp.]
MIDIVQGIGLLCISSTVETSEIQVFLLDKPISINPGLFFNVVPLYGTCTISVAHLGKYDKKKLTLPNELVPSVINPKFSIEKIHTLFYQEKERGFHFKGEKHHFWELTYVDRGMLKTTIEGEVYSLAQGDFILYAPNQYHNQWADDNVSVCFVTITFDMEFKDSHFLANRVFHGNVETKNLLHEILQEKNRNTYYSDDLIICYVKELIIKLVRDLRLESTIHKLSTDMQSNVENVIVSQALDFIHENIHLKLTVSNIASTIPISSSYLSTLFKKNTGHTLMEYINQLRLNKSKEYLRTSSYTITEIADLLGYSSVHYFSKQFKDYYGISPTVYARSIQQ